MLLLLAGGGDEAKEAAGAVVGGSRGVAGWIGGKIEEGKVVAADLERGRSRGRGFGGVAAAMRQTP